MSDFLAGILIHLLHECQTDQSEVHVYTLSQRGPVVGRVVAIAADHACIARDDGRTVQLAFDDILRVGAPAGLCAAPGT